MEEEVKENICLESCPHCERTFLPERLQIHLRSCKADKPLKKLESSRQKRNMGQPKQM
jgi:hypothetical protein